MADTRNDLRLYAVDAPTTTLTLRALPLAVLVSTVLYLTAVETPTTTLVLLPIGTQPAATGGFPTQYLGLKGQRTSGTVDLCLVATADAPAGNSPRIQKGGVTYAVYLVDPGDPDASPFRLKTGAGTKAIRLKT